MDTTDIAKSIFADISYHEKDDDKVASIRRHLEAFELGTDSRERIQQLQRELAGTKQSRDREIMDRNREIDKLQTRLAAEEESYIKLQDNLVEQRDNALREVAKAKAEILELKAKLYDGISGRKL